MACKILAMRVNMKPVFLACFAAMLLAACSSNKQAASAPAEPAPKKESQQITGREAFQRLYVTARAWSPDAQAYFLESSTITGALGHGGKAAIWRAGFASLSRRMQERFQWSGAT